MLREKGSDIEWLDLSGCINVGDGKLTLPLPPLPKLKALKFSSDGKNRDWKYSNTRVSLDTVLALIQQASATLAELSLPRKFEKTNQLIEILSANQHLKKISLRESNIDCDGLSRLLENNGLLEELDISSCWYIEAGVLPNDLSLPHLKKIDLRGSSITLNNIKKLLKAAPQLEELAMPECSNSKADVLPDDLSLPKLKKINLDFGFISIEKIGKLLKTISKLEELNISRFFNINISDLLDHLSLKNLKKIKLEDKIENLEKFLKEAPQLEELDISRSEWHIKDNFFDDLSLPHLKKINLSDSGDLHDRFIITTKNITKLLKAAPQLEELDISQCWKIQGNFSDYLSLPHLKKINLSKSGITTENLTKLLKAAPQLEELDISKCWNIQDDFSDDLSLPHLKEINLSKSCITTENLTKLLKAAPQLKQLDISDCAIILPYHISRDDFLEEIEKQGIRIIDFNRQSPVASSASRIETPDATFSYAAAAAKSTPSHTASSQEKLDANTTFNPEKKHSVERLFFRKNGVGPAPNDYRLSVFDTLEVKKEQCDISAAFTIKNQSEDLQLKQKNEIKRVDQDLFSSLPALPEPDGVTYYGKQTLRLTHEWQALPSLNAQEILLQYHLSDSVKVDIQKSLRDSLYYIRLTPEQAAQSKPVDIDFTILVPRNGVDQKKLPNDIQDIIKDCQSFSAKKLDMSAVHHPTGEDYLSALKKQKVGACRHRTAVFKAIMQKKHPDMPVRIVNNDCHSFVEVFYNQQWISINLGGYPCGLEIDESKKPRPVSEFAPKPTVVSLESSGVIKPKICYFTKSVPKLPPHSAQEYIQHLLSSEHKKVLLNVGDSRDIAGLRKLIEKYCYANKQHPYFYIHKPEDLICAAAYIQYQGKDKPGKIQSGPGGALYDFLMQHKADGTQPVLIVNYANFTSRDLVRFNALLDSDSKADGTSLPLNTKVIGIFDPKKQGAYSGSDFFSRFDQVDAVPLSSAQLLSPKIEDSAPDVPDAGTVEIDLYGGQNWKEKLLGQWDLQGHDLIFKEGELIEQLKQGKIHIILKNAPWQDDAFVSFWQNALLTKQLSDKGRTFALSDNFQLQKSKQEGYTFSRYRHRIQAAESVQMTPQTVVLNLATLSSFYSRYACQQEDHGIISEPGILQQHQNQTIAVYLSHTLPDAAFAEFLSLCEKHNITLQLSRSESAVLPNDFSKDIPIIKADSPTAWNNNLIEKQATSCCVSSDPDVTCAQLAKTKDAIILTISEMNTGDLIGTIDGKFNPKALTFRFENKIGLLTTLLNAGKTVVLTGQFNDETQQQLTRYLLTRSQSSEPAGKLILISDEKKSLSFPGVSAYRHAVRIDEKKALLDRDSFLDDSAIQKYSLSQLRAIARYRKEHPNELDSEAPWQGMRTLPLRKAHSTLPIDLNALAEIKNKAASFDQNRLMQVESALQKSPFVFLAGMTGVGKTTFIQTVWQEKYPAIYFGEDNIASWAKDDKVGRKTLFIDEANISSKNWSVFEGLFCDPPFIVVGNEKFELTSGHKVIFAGNPLSYGDERRMPSLFERHGNSVVFEPMTPEYIAHHMLLPIVAAIPANAQQAIIQPILDIAQYLTNISQQDVLITPRELTMMALLAYHYYREHPHDSVESIAKYYAYHLSQSFVPNEKRTEFDEKFKVEDIHSVRVQSGSAAAAAASSAAPKNILINPSNQSAFHALTDFLSLRQARRDQAVQSIGGLGGVILEGSPGAGKSELVLQTLAAHGLSEKKIIKMKKENPYHQLDQAGNAFYRMPASLALDEKKALLCKAFYEGAVVVIDEINSAPMMERFLNTLLMGQIPDDPDIRQQIQQYQEAHLSPKPGFLLMGTQNPASMGGRARASTALTHRMQTVILPDYTQEEITAIVAHHCPTLSHDVVKEMAAEYCDRRKQDSSSICFRDMLRIADRVVRDDDKDIVKRILDEMEEQGLKNRQFLKNVTLEEIADWVTLPTQGSTFFLAIPLKQCCKKALEKLGMPNGCDMTANGIRQAVHKKITEEKNSHYQGEKRADC